MQNLMEAIENLIEVQEFTVEAVDPEFEDGTTHVAHITFTNPKSQSITYSATVYLADPANLSVPVASSSPKTFTIAAKGSSGKVDFSLTTPLLAVSEFTFIPCCAVSVGGVPIVTFVGAASVKVKFAPAINWGDITWD